MARAKRDDHTIKDGRTLPIFIHSTIDDMTHLSPDTMRVYMHLSRRAGKSGTAWPSYQSIGDHCFISVYKHPDTRRRNAVNAIAELVKAGLLKKDKRLSEHGQLTNCYTLIDPVTLQSQPGGTAESQPGVTPQSQGFVTLESQPAVTLEYPDPVTLQSPKDSPIEDTPRGKNGIISSSSSGEVDFMPAIHPIQHLPYPPPKPPPLPRPTDDPWAVTVAELSRTLAGGFVPMLQESRLELAGEIDGEDGKPVRLYRLIVPAARAAQVPHFTRQAGAEIQKKLSSILSRRVYVEIAVAEPEPTP